MVPESIDALLIGSGTLLFIRLVHEMRSMYSGPQRVGDPRADRERPTVGSSNRLARGSPAGLVLAFDAADGAAGALPGVGMARPQGV